MIEWMDIESAPRDGTVIVVYGKQDDVRDRDGGILLSPYTGLMTAYWDSVDEAWCSTASTYYGPFVEATHWQPLPTPPQ